MAPIVFAHTEWLLAYFLPLISVKGHHTALREQAANMNGNRYRGIVWNSPACITAWRGSCSPHIRRYTQARGAHVLELWEKVLLSSASLHPQATGGCSPFHTCRTWQRVSAIAKKSIKRSETGSSSYWTRGDWTYYAFLVPEVASSTLLVGMGDSGGSLHPHLSWTSIHLPLERWTEGLH